MEDAQVPPDAGDTQSAPARRQTLRLSDAEGVATARLDMFGDPSLKDSLAGAPLNSAGATAPLAVAPSDAPAPGIERGHGAGIDPIDASEHAPGAFEHPAAVVLPEPRPDTPGQGESWEAEPVAAGPAPATSVEASPVPGASDVAGDAVEGTAIGERNGEAVASGPFGAPFMMPPGSPEFDGLGDLSSGPINAPPRFRDELMFVREAASDASATDADAFPDANPDAGLSPSPDLPEEPPFTESSAQLPEDPADPSTFAEFAGPEFAVVPPFPEEGAAFREAAPLPPEPAPPPSSPYLDATARITAEANATAEALDNLRRLLDQNRQHPQLVETDYYRFDPTDGRMVPPARPAGVRGLRLRGIEAEPPPFTIYEPAALLPLPPVPSQPGAGRSVYLLGFLTGLALSLMAGGVLYFFIVHASPG